MMKRFGIGRATTISTCIGVFMVIFVLSTGVGWAQDKATAYPAGLDDPSIELEELQLRLIPLTADQLDSLAAAWQEQARAAAQATVDKSFEIRSAEGTETEALREKRLVLLKERGLIFEKFLAVVSSLEAKGGDPAKVALLRDYISAIRSEEKSRTDAPRICRQLPEVAGLARGRSWGSAFASPSSPARCSACSSSPGSCAPGREVPSTEYRTFPSF
jgi:hypothetical protein